MDVKLRRQVNRTFQTAERDSKAMEVGRDISRPINQSFPSMGESIFVLYLVIQIL